MHNVWGIVRYMLFFDRKSLRRCRILCLHLSFRVGDSSAPILSRSSAIYFFRNHGTSYLNYPCPRDMSGPRQQAYEMSKHDKHHGLTLNSLSPHVYSIVPSIFAQTLSCLQVKLPLYRNLRYGTILNTDFKSNEFPNPSKGRINSGTDEDQKVLLRDEPE
jgi:hypothetical protein